MGFNNVFLLQVEIYLSCKQEGSILMGVEKKFKVDVENCKLKYVNYFIENTRYKDKMKYLLEII